MVKRSALYENDELNLIPKEELERKPTQEDSSEEKTEVKSKEEENKSEEEKVEQTKETTQSKEKVEEEKTKEEEVIKEEPVVPEFSFIEEYNKRFETSFESEDDIISNYTSSKESASELESKYRELSEKYDIALQNLDRDNIFANKEISLYNELIKKYPDKDAALMGTIVNADLQNMSDKDILALQLKLNTPGLSTDAQELSEYIDEKYTSETALKIEAAKARNELTQLKNVELPSALDIDKLRQERAADLEARQESSKQAWTPEIDRLKSSHKLSIDIERNDGTVSPFEYSFSDDNKATVEEMAATFINSGMEATKENVAAVKELAEAISIKRNLPKIIKSVLTREVSKVQEDTLKDLHNPKVSKDTNITQSDYEKSQEETAVFIENEFGKGKRVKNLY